MTNATVGRYEHQDQTQKDLLELHAHLDGHADESIVLRAACRMLESHAGVEIPSPAPDRDWVLARLCMLDEDCRATLVNLALFTR